MAKRRQRIFRQPSNDRRSARTQTRQRRIPSHEEVALPEPSLTQTIDELNTTWILVATVLVFFMQAGFALL